MATQERPLSPHLQVYRPQITSVMSILHRATGVVLALGALVLAGWLVAAASSPGAFESLQAVLASVPGKIALFGFFVIYGLSGYVLAAVGMFKRKSL